MNKIVLCENLIKIANELDLNGKTEAADQITKVISSLNGNTREAFDLMKPWWDQGGGRKKQEQAAPTPPAPMPISQNLMQIKQQTKDLFSRAFYRAQSTGNAQLQKAVSDAMALETQYFNAVSNINREMSILKGSKFFPNPAQPVANPAQPTNPPAAQPSNPPVA